jgi:hypothetical protein
MRALGPRDDGCALILTVLLRLKGAGLGTDQGKERRIPDPPPSPAHSFSPKSVGRAPVSHRRTRPLAERGGGPGGGGVTRRWGGCSSSVASVTARAGWALRSEPGTPADRRPPRRCHRGRSRPGRRRRRAGSAATPSAAGKMAHSEAAQASRPRLRGRASPGAGWLMSAWAKGAWTGHGAGRPPRAAGLGGPPAGGGANRRPRETPAARP